MAKLGWVDAPFLKRYRKWALLGSFIIAAILTPTPDPFNQCLMALPLYVFYEVGIVSAGFFNKKKPVPEESAVPTVATVSAGNGKASAAGLPNVGEGDYVGVPTGRRR
jgi:sec-independent protein translocase protein TatC